MAISKRTRRIVLGYDVDQQSVSEAEQAVTAVRRHAADLKEEFRQANQAIAGYKDEMWDSIKAELDASKATERHARAVTETAKATRAAAADVDDYGKAWREASDQVEAFGDVDTSIAALSGLARGVGAGGVADIGMLGSDIFASVEALGRLPTALSGVGAKALSAVNGVTGLNMSMGQLGAVAAGIGVAVGVAAIAIKNAIEDIARETEVLTQSTIEATGNVFGYIRDGLTSEEALTEAENMQRGLDTLRQQRDEWQAMRDQIDSDAYDAVGVLSGPALWFQETLGMIDTESFDNTIHDLNQQIATAERTHSMLTARIEAGEFAANDAAAAEEALTEARRESMGNMLDNIFAARDGVMSEAATAAETAAAEERERLQGMADIARQFSAESLAIAENTDQQLAELEAKAADRQVAIAEKAADAAEKALDKLVDKQASLQSSFTSKEGEESRQAAQEDLQNRLDLQREEARATRDHARDMQRIREQQRENEVDMLLNSDFRGLYTSRRSTATRLRQSNEDFAAERKERQISFSQEREDNAREREFERQERLIAFEANMKAARAAYDQELKDIKAAKAEQMRELALAHKSEIIMLGNLTNARLQTLAAGAQEELKIAAMTASARAEYEAALLNRYASMAQQMLSAPVAPSYVPKASYTTATSGSYNTVSLTQNIRGTDAKAIAPVVEKIVLDTMQKVIG